MHTLTGNDAATLILSVRQQPHFGWHYAGLACITVDGFIPGRERCL